MESVEDNMESVEDSWEGEGNMEGVEDIVEVVEGSDRSSVVFCMKMYLYQVEGEPAVASYRKHIVLSSVVSGIPLTITLSARKIWTVEMDLKLLAPYKGQSIQLLRH